MQGHASLIVMPVGSISGFWFLAISDIRLMAIVVTTPMECNTAHRNPKLAPLSEGGQRISQTGASARAC
jgi:hypothetical protein